jgi:tetratricopeptide (TPR) repeat protein
MINYRYRIVEKLGEGGSGEVFQVEDTLKKNQLLAMKILHSAEKIGSAGDEAFRNEVSQLIKLSHPNLVRIFDFGIVRHAQEDFLLQRRFFTMEFVKGVDALQWVTSNVHPQKKEALLEVLLLQALSVLDYVHREGIIHFDVKPQNLVLVGEQDSSDVPLVKLMDFGFSKKRDEVLQVSIRGTLEYTAPELLKGEPFDHRVDLYSLGATFFHLWEGKCPFEATEPVDLVKQVLNDEVRFSAGPDSRLRAVIQGLMEKNPEHRFCSAEEAARSLVSKMPSGSELFESYFGLSRQPKFVGRRNELEILQGAIAKLTAPSGDPQPAAVVVTGVEGIGKTALLREAVKFARSRELSVYEMESLPNGVPFQAVASIVPLLACDVRCSTPEGSALRDRYAAILGFDNPDALRFDVWGEKAETYIEVISRFLIECSNVVPFILVADNLHLIDGPSVRILRMALRDAPAGRLFILAAEMGDAGPSVLSDGAVPMHLRELDRDEVTAMSASALGPSGAVAEIGSLLFTLYGGTPSIVVEALNALADLVTPEELRGADATKLIASLEAKLPRNIDEFLMARFQKLNRERQLTLNIAACLQYPIRPELLIHLLPFHRLRSTDHIRFLLLEGLLGLADNDQVLFIRMKRLKDAVYDSIGQEKAELHALIASTLEEHIAGKDFTELQELAFQFSASGNHEKASRYYEKAADVGLEQFAIQRSLQLIDHAIRETERTGERDRLLELQVRRVAVLYRAGMFKEAVEAGAALSNQVQSGQRATLFKHMGLSLSRLGDNERAQEYINRVLQESTNELERLELRQELVGLEIAAGHFKQAEESCRNQLELAIGLKNNRLLGAIYTDLGIVSFFQDRFDDAVQYFAEALRTFELINEKTQVTNALNNIGNALSAKGDYHKAIQYWERALKASLEFGTLNLQAQIYSNLGIAHYNLKQYGRAKEFYTRALSLCKRTESKIAFANALMNLGEVLFAEGEYEAALRTWLQAKELYASMDAAHMLAETCLHIADVFGRIGDVQTMETQLNHAAAIMAEHQLDTYAAMYHYLRGVCNQKKGDLAEAEQSFDRVCERLQTDETKELYFLAVIRRAECRFYRGESVRAAKEILDVQRNPHVASLPLIVAELNYLLGMIAAVKPDAVPEKAIVYFKRGMEAIAKEPVSEITWKLAYALAHEYYERGQHERAKEFLVKTRLVLKFFLSHFRSDEMKQRYLAADQKDRVLATIDSILKP